MMGIRFLPLDIDLWSQKTLENDYLWRCGIGIEPLETTLWAHSLLGWAN